MVKITESDPYDIKNLDRVSTQSDANNKLENFHSTDFQDPSKRSKFVATCYCSRRPGKYQSKKKFTILLIYTNYKFQRILFDELLCVQLFDHLSLTRYI